MPNSNTSRSLHSDTRVPTEADTKTRTRPLVAKVVTDIRAFAALQGGWNDLLAQSNQASVFLSWEWLYTWWEVFESAERELRIITVFDGSTLVGVAPFYLHSPRRLSAKLRWIGTGEDADDEIVSEYLDVVARRGREDAVLECLTDALKEDSCWRSIELSDLVSGHLALKLFSALSGDFASMVVARSQRYFVPLEGSQDDYLMRLSNSRRKRLKRCRKAIEKDANGLRRVSITSADDIKPQLELIRTLHNQRWSGRDGGGVYDSKRFSVFHEKVLNRLYEDGRGGIEVFYLNDKPIAALHLYYSEETCHYYQSGFSNEGTNRYMPLFVSHVEEIERSRDRGLQEYDFMRGGEGSYKTDFGCDSEPMMDVFVYRVSFAKRYHVMRRFARRLGKSAYLMIRSATGR